MSLKALMPWYLKIPAKIVLSRLPVSLRFWQSLDLFRAGRMDSQEYAKDIFDKHFRASGLPDLKRRIVLELGPGNGLLTAKFATDLGADLIWLIDASRLAKTRSLPLNVIYLTGGLASLKSVTSASVDFFFSNAVLEHIRLSELQPVISEMWRILKPGGISSHVIDFRDHLQESLNNYRFSESTWESKFMASSGFYTNRVPWPKMRCLLAHAGFSLSVVEELCWPVLPLRQSLMAEPFKTMPAQELLCYTCHCLAVKR